MHGWASPIDFWRAAVLVFNDCLLSDHEGGYSTYEFAKVVNWITAPNVSSCLSYYHDLSQTLILSFALVVVPTMFAGLSSSAKTGLTLGMVQTIFLGNLNLQASLTFLTATVRYFEEGVPSSEPGSFDPATAIWFYERLYEAIGRAPPGSSLEVKFVAWSYVGGSEEAMLNHPGECRSALSSDETLQLPYRRGSLK